MIDEVDGHVVLTNGNEVLDVPAMAMRVEISGLHSSGITTGPQGPALGLAESWISSGCGARIQLLG